MIPNNVLVLNSLNFYTRKYFILKNKILSGMFSINKIILVLSLHYLRLHHSIQNHHHFVRICL